PPSRIAGASGRRCRCRRRRVRPFGRTAALVSTSSGRDDGTSGDPRPTRIGLFIADASTTERRRDVPVPWIDCPACGWRHYPATAGGRWHIATTCEGCAADLTDIVD